MKQRASGCDRLEATGKSASELANELRNGGGKSNKALEEHCRNSPKL